MVLDGMGRKVFLACMVVYTLLVVSGDVLDNSSPCLVLAGVGLAYSHGLCEVINDRVSVLSSQSRSKGSLYQVQESQDRSCHNGSRFGEQTYKVTSNDF